MGGFARAPSASVLTMANWPPTFLPSSIIWAFPTAVFVGCSIGGYVLLELWRRSPANAGLAFICSKPQPDAEANLARRAANIEQIKAGGKSGLFDAMAQTLTGSTAAGAIRRLSPSCARA